MHSHRGAVSLVLAGLIVCTGTACADDDSNTTTGGLPYNLSSWVIPATTGGSLSVVSAPTSAVIATTGMVTVGWTGLTAGVQYLGDVAHVRPCRVRVTAPD